MSGLRDVPQGAGLEDLSADDFTRNNRATRWVEAQQASLAGNVSKDIRPGVQVRVKNNSGGALPRYSILGIDSPLFHPRTYLNAFQQEVALIGVTPDASLHSGKFVVLAEPLHDGEVGFAWASGLAPVKLDPDTADDATHVDCIDGQTAQVAGGTSGMPIVWLDDEDDGYDRWAVINLLPAAPQNISSGTSGNSGGCCAPCIPCKYMTAARFYAPNYYTKNIPAELIPADSVDGELALHFIGLADGTTVSGATDGNPYFESDTFDWSCTPAVTGDCPSGVWAEIVAAGHFTSLMLDQRAGTAISGSGTATYYQTSETVSWTASLDFATSEVSLSWVSGSLGACSVTCTVATPDGSICEAGTYDSDDYAYTGVCNQITSIGVTITTGNPATELTDTYLWRMVVHGDGNGPCPALGSEDADLFLVHEGSGMNCPALTGANCTRACSDIDGSNYCDVCPQETQMGEADGMWTVDGGPSGVGVSFAGNNPYNEGCLWVDGTESIPVEYGDGSTFYATLNLNTGELTIHVEDTVDGTGDATYTGTIVCEGEFEMTLASSSGTISFQSPITFTVL